jgi:hypothetical protein
VTKIVSPVAPCPYDTRCPPCTKPISKGEDAQQVYHFYVHAGCAADIPELLEWDPDEMEREHRARVLRMGPAKMRELYEDGIIDQIEYDLHMAAWRRCGRWTRLKARVARG